MTRDTRDAIKLAAVVVALFALAIVAMGWAVRP